MDITGADSRCALKGYCLSSTVLMAAQLGVTTEGNTLRLAGHHETESRLRDVLTEPHCLPAATLLCERNCPSRGSHSP